MEVIFLALVLFLADRFLKYFFAPPATDWFSGRFLVWGDWLSWQPSYNKGVAFGLTLAPWLLWPLCLVILLLLIDQWFKAARRGEQLIFLAWSLIIFGAGSNLLDRFYFGAVVDYFAWIDFSVFNLADVMIVCGLLIFLLKKI